MTDRSNPFENLEELLNRLNRQFETAARSWESDLDTRSRLDLSMGGATTQLDLADHGDEFTVTVDVPGYETDDLELELRGDTLEISGERESEHERALEEEDADETPRSEATYIRREREMQSFSRQIRLPDPVEADAVTAAVNNGILTVHLPKRDSSDDSRSIEIE
ncbi:Hsp20/alpha crystallin family protein [Natronorubrum halophilum]|uniref:Hsp20/alpha crystallin family protein n=1 Tax=Natronorubrum halophilum TaxID=1702106 RepID=UPI0010C1D7F8|nr:Hsp20/alpha crystallin family protein [Natronorubrum halophilum]